MERIPPFGRNATYADLERVPDSCVAEIAEIAEGGLYASPRPALRHAYAASMLGASLAGPGSRPPSATSAWWILDEPELHLDAGTWRSVAVFHDAAHTRVEPIDELDLDHAALWPPG